MSLASGQAAAAAAAAADDDGVLMAQALEEAEAALVEGNRTLHLTPHASRVTRHALLAGEVPIGCVVTRHGR